MINSLTIMMNQAGSTPLLSPEREHLLAKRREAGDTVARERLILANMRLVVSIARNWGHSSLSKDDLIQTGYEGLIKAVDSFDSSKGTKLSTHATYWITNEVRRAVQNADMIQIPVHYQDGRYDSIDAPAVLRFEAPVGSEDSGTTLGDNVPAANPYETSDFENMLSGLTEREADILRRRYRDDETMQEVADRQGVSRQAIHQVERRALDKLVAA